MERDEAGKGRFKFSRWLFTSGMVRIVTFIFDTLALCRALLPPGQFGHLPEVARFVGPPKWSL